jgi:hypothetical protein
MRLLTSLLAASLCVGGFAHWNSAAADEPTCHIVLFGKKNFEAGSDGFRIIFTDTPDLRAHDFNNRTSSFVIVKGRWRLYTKSEYGGERTKRLGPGLYADVTEVGVDRNQISSLRCRDD